MLALERFGVNKPMRAAIANIYSERSFRVRDGGYVSEPRQQKAGISQCCPFSPFLFGIFMTVLMADAQSNMSAEARAALHNKDLEDIPFADDTLLIATTGQHLQEYMTSVTHCGKQYGLEIHLARSITYQFVQSSASLT